MIIGVVPSIKETYLNQIEISLDIKLINFLKKIYKSPKINILHQKKFSEIDLLCLSGGNDLTRFKNDKPNIIRSQLDKFYYQICKKKNIPILGICYGAQFIVSYEGGEMKKKNHLGKHEVIFANKDYKRIVNSYHNFIITKLSKKFEIIATARDGSIECFKYKNKKIMGVIWHPERELSFRKNDFNLIRKFL